jgi:hypothetical protein
MAEVVWGQLGKAVSDPTTISEEIDADVLAHNEDPSAHRQTDEAIDTHRTAAILDHLARSVTVGKLDQDKLYLQPSFESLDAWVTSAVGVGAATDVRVGSCKITTGDAVGNITKIAMEAMVGGPATDNDPFFQCDLDFSSSPAFQDVAVGCGSWTPWAPTDFFGFRWSKADSKMYAYYYRSGVETKFEISGYDIGIVNTLRAEMSASGETLKFYVNDMLKKEYSAADMQMDSDIYFCFANKSQVAAPGNYEAIVRNVFYAQDRD